MHSAPPLPEESGMKQTPPHLSLEAAQTEKIMIVTLKVTMASLLLQEKVPPIIIDEEHRPPGLRRTKNSASQPVLQPPPKCLKMYFSLPILRTAKTVQTHCQCSLWKSPPTSRMCKINLTSKP
ncbi:hypothetical protein NPIL_49601 [Nephila pilipes]|uniref:Uncharacterized protein n=1 Tax=Nephila pilipes TaxID=299642 RepID=A0A8X6JQV6_NEPPI|nr:hypothetical protein NPIL_49601 [Nephila pilipes]